MSVNRARGQAAAPEAQRVVASRSSLENKTFELSGLLEAAPGG